MLHLPSSHETSLEAEGFRRARHPCRAARSGIRLRSWSDGETGGGRALQRQRLQGEVSFLIHLDATAASGRADVFIFQRKS